MVLNHPAHVQIFDADHIEAAHEVGGEFMQIILAGIRNLLVQTGDLDSLPFVPATALHAARQGALFVCQPALRRGKKLGIRNVLVGREGRQAIHAQIDADSLTRLRPLRFRLIQDQGHKVATRGGLGYRHRRWTRNECARKAEVEVSQLTDRERLGSGVPLERRARIFCRLLPMLLFEGRIVGAFFKKVLERDLQVAQRLLGGNRRDFIQPRVFGLLLEGGEGGGRSWIVDGMAAAIGIGAECQSPVVDVARGAEDPR